MSLDNLKYFKQIDNITEYVKDGIKSGKLNIDEVSKFARISARQGEIGEEVITKMANGLEETRNSVKADEKTGNPGWIVTNPDGEEYIVEDSTFQKKYEIDVENPSQYKPKGGPVLAAKLPEHIEFVAPWGETMKIEYGGSLMLNGPGDIYGIQGPEFNNTYKSTGKDKSISMKEAMSMFGLEEKDLIKQTNEKSTKITEDTRNKDRDPDSSGER